MLFYSVVMLILVSYIGYVAIDGIVSKEIRFPDRRKARIVSMEANTKTYWACVAFYAGISVFLGAKAARWGANAVAELNQKSK